MIKKLLLLLLTVFIVSCGTSKKTSSTRTVTKKTTRVKTAKPSNHATKTAHKATAIIETALTYEGTRYKFGGTTKKGMDCSGLTFTAFGAHEVQLPRISYQQATQGKRISLRDVQEGDLLFFKTNKNKKRINHVGLVVEINNGEIKFIHSTTSRGVLISSMEERFWKHAFTEARRVL